jgi:hypothetical protein
VAGNRAAAEAFILKFLNAIAPKSENVEIYKKIFAAMNDKDFDQFIDDLDKKRKYITIIAPNFTESGITVENNLKLGEKMGVRFFQKLWIEGDADKPTYQTPIEYLVLDLPFRRASQTLTKKISVPKHNRVIDSLTGQPTGESKGAKISYPEVQLAAAMGLENCMVELMKYRGGDVRGGAALAGMMSKYGRANMKALAPFASGVESTKSLKTLLAAAHLKSNL